MPVTTPLDPIEVAAKAGVDQIEAFLREFDRAQRQAPPETPPPIAGVPGFWQMASSAFALAYSADAGEIRLAEMSPEDRRQVVRTIDRMVQQHDRYNVNQARAAFQLVADAQRAWLRYVRANYSVDSPGEPNPSEILSEEIAQLRHSVAWDRAWGQGHHRLTHLPASVAVEGYASTEAVAAGAIGDTLVEVAQALRVIVDHRIPNLREQLDERIQRVREALHSTDVDLRHAIADLRGDVDARLDRLVRLITEEIVPDVEELISIEQAQRARADRQLQRGISEESDARTDADASILAKIAPIAAWMGSFGLQTTTKVNKLEPSFDQMLGPGFDVLSAILIPGALGALVLKLIERAGSATPEVFAGVESYAAKLLRQ